MTQEFRIKKDGFSEINKPIILKIVIMLFVALIIGLGIKSKGFTSNIDTLLIVAPIVIALFSVIVFFSMRRVKKQFESFTLIINKNEIIREQLYMKNVVIPIHEIKSITKNEKGGITIQGKSNLAQEMIFVPKQLENLDKLKKTLSEISPIQIK